MVTHEQKKWLRNCIKCNSQLVKLGMGAKNNKYYIYCVNCCYETEYFKTVEEAKIWWNKQEVNNEI